VQERVPRFRRQYKIQEVIKRRQVMLVQVVKEERGTKGAALTTYLSLAGRYSVLMPNTARGGGISRKITSAEDRGRLKEIAQELEVPEGMGVILRTAGANRTKTEVKRDFEYLLRLWETVRDLTLRSNAPTLVYEEGSLVKRSIRDLYNKDIDEIVVAGEEGYKEARDFMRMLMPSHVKNVILYKDSQPLFTRYAIESQLDAMFSPTVQLKSGGYIVINQAEALVAIDVNSGRATREHHIEDTALKTNVEAAEEVARQLRLRDLAGLIVIDFIDMDESRNNRTVERRMKDALKHDRARIQVGRISHFGLLEMSRQRIRSSVLESSTEKCPVCGGSGHVRSVSSVALQLLRAIEETLNKGATHNLIVRTRAEVALYVLNHKRAHLRMLEERYRITITISADASVNAQQSYVVDRGEQVHSAEAARALAAQVQPELLPPPEEEAEPEAIDDSEEVEEEVAEPDEAEEASAAPETEGEPRGRGRRRRRGRGRGRDQQERPERQERPSQAAEFTHETAAEHAVEHEDHEAATADDDQPREGGAAGEPANGDRDSRRRRRRGRRGGRRNRQRNGEAPFGESAGSDADLEHAVEDMDTPGFAAERPAPQPRDEHPVPTAEAEFPPPPARTPEPAPAMAAPIARAAAPATEPPAEPPRRRSTIREPAPTGGTESPMPTAAIPKPEPVVVSTAPEPAAPKRGWWGKRLLGGN
jgi:ribonuclease E